MNARIIGVAVIVGVVVASVAYLVLPRRPAPGSATAVTATEPRRDPPAASPATPDTPPAATPRATAPRASRKPSAAAPEAAPSTAPAATELGALRITTDVPGASVFLDRQFVGTAPVTAENVKPGTHQLNVTADGFDGIARSIDVEPGPRDLSIRFKEVRLNAMLAVVHKHRVGSCTGQLIASPQGLRYETSDKADGFNVPLKDLEAFAVDYQDKNLKIKVRKGKQYNFTDPDGNSDRLFVFQRDVDKVRQRLAKGDAPAQD